MTKAKTAKTAKSSAAPKKAVAKKAPAKAKSKTAAATSTKKQPTSQAVSTDWSATIKKAAEDKRSHASWPGTGDAWKKKTRF